MSETVEGQLSETAETVGERKVSPAEGGESSAVTETAKEEPSAAAENVGGKNEPSVSGETTESKGSESGDSSTPINVEGGKESLAVVETEKSLAPADNVESDTESAARVENVEGRQSENCQPCLPIENSFSLAVGRFSYAVLALPLLILGAFLVKTALNQESRVAFTTSLISAAVFFLGSGFFMFKGCFYPRQGFNPSQIWSAAGGHSYSSRYSRSSLSSSRQQDIESQSQVSSASTATVEAAEQERSFLQTSTSRRQIGSVKKISEVAGSVSKIALETVPEKGESLESSMSTEDGSRTQTEESKVKEKTDSDTEVPSSGELRRRKFPNPDECKELSSDDDSQKKE